MRWPAHPPLVGGGVSHLLGIAHPIMGKHFQVPKVHRERRHIQDLSYENGPDLAYSCIL